MKKSLFTVIAAMVMSMACACALAYNPGERTMHLLGQTLNSTKHPVHLVVEKTMEDKTGIPFIRMDQGSPGLPMNKYGIEAEKKALDSGICSQYPAASGVKELKEAASRFVKAFIDIDINPEGCVPTTGSGAASFGSYSSAIAVLIVSFFINYRLSFYLTYKLYHRKTTFSSRY